MAKSKFLFLKDSTDWLLVYPVNNPSKDQIRVKAKAKKRVVRRCRRIEKQKGWGQ